MTDLHDRISPLRRPTATPFPLVATPVMCGRYPRGRCRPRVLDLLDEMDSEA